METLFKRNKVPDAVICGYDDMALGAMKCISDHGLKVPDDIMVMGMNDISMSKYFNPPLSTVSLKDEMTCKMATDMLLARLKGEEYPDFVKIKCELKLRKSTLKQ